MNEYQRGFWHSAQMEIAICVAVIGVLVAIGIPVWQDYNARSRVSAGIALAMPARDAVTKIFADHGPADMVLQISARRAPPAPTEDVQSVSIGRDGVITVRFTENIAPANENQVQIVPVAGGKAVDLSDVTSKGKKFEWQCGGAAGRTTVPARYLPKECRPYTYGDTGEDGRLRGKVREALEGATAPRMVIDEYFRQHRKFPPDLKTMSNIRYDAKSGSLVVQLPEQVTLEGPVVLVPSPGEGDKLEWSCKGPGIPKQDRRHLPEHCS